MIENQKKEKIFTFIKWPFSVLFIVTSLRALIADQIYLAFLCYLLIGLLLFPPLTEFWRMKFPFLKNRIYKGIILFIILLISGTAFN